MIIVENANSFLQPMRPHFDEWLRCALSTEPLSKQCAQDAVSQAYAIAGLQRPSRFVWVKSPLAGALAAEALLLRRYKNVGKQVIGKQLLTSNQKLWAGLRDVEEFRYLLSKYGILFAATSMKLVIQRQIGRGLNFLSRSKSPVIARRRFCFDWQGAVNQISDQLTIEEQKVLTDWRYFSGSSLHNWNFSYGGMHADLISRLDCLQSGQPPVREWQGIVSTARHCGWWWPFEDICVISERPKLISLDDAGNSVHNEDGPALVFRDNWKIFARNGSVVSRRVISFKKRPRIRDIEYVSNIETRRHMIEIYGYEAYVKDAGAKVIAQDQYGVLFRKEHWAGEPLVLLCVDNSTPEPDGSYKKYYLRVPPNMRTPREAVAWSFEMEVDAYSPVVET